MAPVGFSLPLQKLFLDIQFDEESLPTQEKKELRALCKSLGRGSMAAKAAWGYGPIHKSSCRRQSGKKKPIPSYLSLEVAGRGDAISLELIFHFPAAKGQKVRKAKSLVRLGLDDSSDKALAALKDPQVVALLMGRLFNDAPVAGVIPKLAETIDLPSRGAGDPPSNLLVYTLALNEEEPRFLPRKVAMLQLDKGKTSASRLHYKMRHLANFHDKNQQLYFHRIEGPGFKNALLEAQLNGRLQAYGSKLVKLGDFELASLIGGVYAGFRYGYPLTSGNVLIAKSSMVGIFTVVRSGPMQGLSWYWDFAPRTTEVVEGEEVYFEWSRPTLGWAIEFPLMNNMLGDFHLDLTPKLGAMDMSAKLPVTSADGVTSASQFEVKNALSFGIDGGISWRTDWFFVRGWGAADLAGLLSLGSNTHSISSRRAGFDTFWDLFTIFDKAEFSLLVFGSVESLTIEKNLSADEQAEAIDAESPDVSGLSFNTAFFGVGATIQW
jgi:hypothetical protein